MTTATKNKPRIHGTATDRGMAILPIGRVNLLTGKNKMFGTVWDCWEEDERGWNMLVVSHDVPQTDLRKYRIIHSSGKMDIDVGDLCYFCHDQTRARIGNRWRVLATGQHTKTDLASFLDVAGCPKSVSMSTFK